MKNNARIDDELVAEALEVGGFKTKKPAIEEGLPLIIRTRGQDRIRRLRGKLEWEGSLDGMRRGE